MSNGQSGKGDKIAAKSPQTPATKPAAAAKNTLSIRREPGEDLDLTLVKARLHPVTSATATIRGFEKPLAEHDFGSLVTELSRHVEDVKAGNMNRPEMILLTQAQTLDVIFNSLAQRAAANVGQHMGTAETYLRMALKAQAQCRTTLETLAEIKAPRSTNFIKQANIAQQQQVNNGSQVNNGNAQDQGNGTPAHAHGKNINPNQTNEQLEDQHGKRLDARTTGKTVGINPQLETMGAIDRTKNTRRKKQ
jgi:hypothetical protein